MTFCSIITAKKLTLTTPNAYHSSLRDGSGGTTLVVVRKKVLLFLFLTFFISPFFNSTFAQSVPGYNESCYTVNIGSYFNSPGNGCPIKICIDQLISCNGVPFEIVQTCRTIYNISTPQQICLLTPSGPEGNCTISTYDIVVSKLAPNGQSIESITITNNADFIVNLIKGTVPSGNARLCHFTLGCDGNPYSGLKDLWIDRQSAGTPLIIDFQ